MQDKEKAIEYLKKWQAVDTANADAIQKNLDILQKTGSGKSTPGPRGNSAPKQTGGKPSPNTKPDKPVSSGTVKK